MQNNSVLKKIFRQSTVVKDAPQDISSRNDMKRGVFKLLRYYAN
jgi:hypothetical protein